MRNSMAAGRRLALRVVTLQALVAIVVALLFLFVDRASALAAGVGGAAVVAGNALFGLRSFAGPPQGAGPALARLVFGMVLKWCVVLGTLYVALARLHLPPLPLLAGMVASTLAFLLIGKSSNKGGM